MNIISRQFGAKFTLGILVTFFKVTQGAELYAENSERITDEGWRTTEDGERIIQRTTDNSQRITDNTTENALTQYPVPITQNQGKHMKERHKSTRR